MKELGDFFPPPGRKRKSFLDMKVLGKHQSNFVKKARAAS